MAEEEFAQSDMEKKRKEKKISSKVQEAQWEVQTRRWDCDDITKFRTHLFFLQEEYRCLLEGGNEGENLGWSLQVTYVLNKLDL